MHKLKNCQSRQQVINKLNCNKMQNVHDESAAKQPNITFANANKRK